jgi:hypothetical protein
MRGRLAALAGAFSCLTAAALAQDAADRDAKTVPRESVKSWITRIDGREWSVRTAAPSYDGDTGLFRLSTAYTLPRGRAAVGLFRNNLDRDPKGIDFSVHGITFAYGATNRLELFASGGLQHRLKVNYPTDPGYPNDYPFAGGESWATGFGDIKVGA